MARSDAQTRDNQGLNIQFRPLYPRDVDLLNDWSSSGITVFDPACESFSESRRLSYYHSLSLWRQRLETLAVPNRPRWPGFVVTLNDTPCGAIGISPFNRTRSTWRVDRIFVNPAAVPAGPEGPLFSIGSQLLRYCFETIWEARMWLAEVDIEQKAALALYRQNGFQPLAQVTYWEISPGILAQLAAAEPDFPNLMAVSNADAQLLYQLDTAAMPPLVRQVFDQQIQDFKVEPLSRLTKKVRCRMQGIDPIQGYVFEPQRKAAIGRFELTACQRAGDYHSAELTVHPAYTWLYPEIISHMAQLLQTYPEAPLRVNSRDYQAEREDYLNQLQAEPVKQTLMLSRSVWHKVRESRLTALEGLQLPEVLAGLQPTGKPVPGRISWQRELEWNLSLSRSSVHRSMKKGQTLKKSRRQAGSNNLSGESG